MTKQTSFKPAAAIGFALVGSLAVANLANAAENPFGATVLKGGYMQLAEAGKCGGEKMSADDKKKAEGKCGEGKCGAAGKAAAEGKCGGEKKAGEAKCGGAKKPAEAKCGGAK